jgi:tellurite resistance protein
MSGYAQLMKKTGGMTKKGKKETPAQNLVRELLTNHGVQSPGASQGPVAATADVVAASPEVQAAKKRKLILRNRQKSPAVAAPELEAVQPASQNEISISDDEEAETIGLALRRQRG